MRIGILLLTTMAASACGDPVRRGDGYFGEDFARFTARLTGPPMGYAEGDRLLPWLQDVSGRGGSADGTDQFQPQSFPHDFIIDFSAAPRGGMFSAEARTDPAHIWYVQVTVESLRGPLQPSGLAASVNHWIAYSAEPIQIFPFGPGETPLNLPAGFSLVRRACSPGQLNQYTIAPASEVIVVEPIAQDFAENEYRARCGAPLLPDGWLGL